jgi:hypothetical protein
MMPFPVRAPLAVRRASRDFILHDRRTGAVHRLNSVAGVIWHLCDGNRDRSAIISEVAAVFGKPPREVAADVDETLARFVDVGLVHSSAHHRETDALLRCVRASLGSSPVEDVPPPPASDLDWTYIEQTALQHGVMPLLYRGLRGLPAGAVPNHVVHRLEYLFGVNAARNAVLFQELLELLKLFEASGIRAVPLKGPVLAALLYGDVALRQFGDLDILVPEEQVGHAKELLSRRGCRFRLSAEDSVLAEYETPNASVRVDLHWTLAPKTFRIPLDLDELWTRVARQPVGGATVLQPAPGDQLRILSAHGTKHCWSKLVWISDMSAFIERHRTSLDWPGVMAQSGRAGGARVILIGARLASDVLGSIVPDELLRRTKGDTAVAPLATELRRRLFSPVETPNSVRGTYGAAEGDLFYIRTRERVRDKLPHIRRLLWRPVRRLATIFVPNDRDRSVIALPRHSRFLYYLVRPLRLTIEYWEAFMQRFHVLR